MRTYFSKNESIKLNSNGTYIVDIVSDAKAHVVAAAAYDSDGNIVTASGNISVSMAPIRGQFHSKPSDGINIISLAMAGESATYEMPVFVGPVSQAKIELSGLSGADHVVCFVWSEV